MTNWVCRMAAVVLVALAMTTPAEAWWRGGVFFGVAPVFPAPYAVYPPPLYLAPVYLVPAFPPPVYAVPAEPAPAPAASQAPRCYAGSYVCPLEQAIPAGYACSCPTDHAGRAAGRAG